MPTENATIFFGSYKIGVKLENTMKSENGTVKFQTLHETTPDGEPCLTPVKQEKKCPKCEVLVSPETTVRGYKVSKDNFVLVSNEEYAEVEAIRSSVVVLKKFIDPLEAVWADRSYWLSPQSMSERPYALLSGALSRQGKWGLGLGAIWGKERPYAVECNAGRLRLLVLHTALEYVQMDSPAPVDLPEIEERMADEMVKAWSAPLEHEDLVSAPDTLMRAMVEAKIAGLDFTAPEPMPEPTPTVDLMEAMKETIEMGRERRKEKVA